MYIIGANFSQTLTAAEALASGKTFGLRDLYAHADGSVWAWVKASAAIAMYDLVVYDETHQTVVAPLTTTNGLRGRKVGVSAAAFAVGDQGWLQIYGTVGNLNVLASAVAHARLNTTATGGSPDDDGGVGSKEILGVVLTTARAASNGPAPASLNWPIIGATL